MIKKDVDLKIVVVIPAYNEEKKVGKTIRDVTGRGYEVILVDDCSTDKTYEIVLSEKKVRLLKHLINRGQGAALQTGTKKAIDMGADIVVHFDADGQFCADEIKDLVQPITDSEADIVIGSRFLGKEAEMPFLKKNFIMPLAKLFLKYFYDSNLTDPQNGFRAFDKKVAQELEIENDGAAHCTEIIIKVLKNKWRLKEVPVTVRYDEFGQGLFSGKGRGSGVIRILFDLFISKLIK